VRGFKSVKKECQKYPRIETVLPTRSDNGSAGYDFYLKRSIILKPGETQLIFSDVKAYMQPDEVLYLYIRSGISLNQKINFINSVGVIDSTYFENPKNDGNIGFTLTNNNDEHVMLKEGERVAQGVFMKYLTADNDNVQNEKRNGGFGSSGK